MEKYGFFSSVDGDRLYTAADFTSYFGRFLTNGYFSVEPEGLKVTANGTLELTVNAGSMWINGHIYELTEPKVLTVDTQANFARRDRVVIKLDHVAREIRAEIKKGEGSEYPVYCKQNHWFCAKDCPVCPDCPICQKYSHNGKREKHSDKRHHF